MNKNLGLAESYLCRHYKCHREELQERLNNDHSIETITKVLKKYRIGKFHDVMPLKESTAKEKSAMSYVTNTKSDFDKGRFEGFIAGLIHYETIIRSLIEIYGK